MTRPATTATACNRRHPYPPFNRRTKECLRKLANSGGGNWGRVAHHRRRRRTAGSRSQRARRPWSCRLRVVQLSTTGFGNHAATFSDGSVGSYRMIVETPSEDARASRSSSVTSVASRCWVSTTCNASCGDGMTRTRTGGQDGDGHLFVQAPMRSRSARTHACAEALRKDRPTLSSRVTG